MKKGLGVNALLGKWKHRMASVRDKRSEAQEDECNMLCVARLSFHNNLQKDTAGHLTGMSTQHSGFLPKDFKEEMSLGVAYRTKKRQGILPSPFLSHISHWLYPRELTALYF